MERLKALLAVVIFAAMILFSHPGKTSGRREIQPHHNVTMSPITNDTTINSIYNHLPESNPDMAKMR